MDTTQSVLVGTHTIGSKEVGGGPSSSQVEAFPYVCPISVRLDKFMRRKIKLEAKGIGYVSVSAITDHDIRVHEAKLPRKYR